MIGVRIWELLVLLTWLFGLWLCLRHTRRSLLLGVYIGTSLSFGYDWFFAESRLWHMSFHPDTVMMFHWFGQPQALWSPLSYGFFFGIAAFLSLRFRGWLDARLGAWQYLLAFPMIFLLNLLVEGTAIQLWQVNTYHLPAQFLIGNIPWMHGVTTGIMFSGAVFLARQAYELAEAAGWQDFRSDPPGRANGNTKLRWQLLILGIAVPQAAFYAALVAAMFLYNALGIPQ